MILDTDLKVYYSGGASNSNGNLSLGGVISSVELVEVIHYLYDVVDNAEAESGDVEYRCVYVKNNSAETLYSAKIYINQNTSSVDTQLQIGLGSSAINGEEQTIANESTAPVGITYSTANGSVNALSIGDMAAGDTKAIWFKRIINAVSAASLDNVNLVFNGIAVPA